MRLIDADALINELYDFAGEHTYVNDDGDLIIFEVPTWVDYLISVAPTIETIPIEWLEDRLAHERRPTVRNWLEKLMRDFREEQKNETD